jgi:hypothetical protein
MSIWEKEKAKDQMQAAKEVREAGQLLTATEIRSTRRYYHVRNISATLLECCGAPWLSIRLGLEAPHTLLLVFNSSL